MNKRLVSFASSIHLHCAGQYWGPRLDTIIVKLGISRNSWEQQQPNDLRAPRLSEEGEGHTEAG